MTNDESRRPPPTRVFRHSGFVPPCGISTFDPALRDHSDFSLIHLRTLAAACFVPVPSTLWSAVQMILYSRSAGQFRFSHHLTRGQGTMGSNKPVSA